MVGGSARIFIRWSKVKTSIFLVDFCEDHVMLRYQGHLRISASINILMVLKVSQFFLYGEAIRV